MSFRVLSFPWRQCWLAAPIVLISFFPPESFQDRSLSKCSVLLSDRFLLSAKLLFHSFVECWTAILPEVNYSSVSLFAFRSQLTVVICRCFKPISIRSCVIWPPLALSGRDGLTPHLLWYEVPYGIEGLSFPVRLVCVWLFTSAEHWYLSLLKCFSNSSLQFFGILPIVTHATISLFKRNQANYGVPITGRILFCCTAALVTAYFL